MNNKAYPDLDTAIERARTRARRTAITQYIHREPIGYSVSTKPHEDTMQGYVDSATVQYHTGLPDPVAQGLRVRRRRR